MLKKEEHVAALSQDQGMLLVRLARRTIHARLGGPLDGQEGPELEDGLRVECFRQKRGTFVCLKIDGRLRGCIGNLHGTAPLVESVKNNALAAAFEDSRFSPLTAEELPQVRLEVSVLTEPIPLLYLDGADLIARLRPGVHGVILRRERASATFLPQVWAQLPEPVSFLSQLCLKAGLPASSWQQTPLEIMTYQVQYFTE